MKKKILALCLSAVMMFGAATSVFAEVKVVDTNNPSDGVIYIPNIDAAKADLANKSICVGQTCTYKAEDVFISDTENILFETTVKDVVDVKAINVKKQTKKVNNVDVETGKYVFDVLVTAKALCTDGVKITTYTSNGTKINNAEITIKVVNHTSEKLDAKEAKVGENGNTEGAYCSTCGYVITPTTIIPKLEKCEHKNNFKAKDSGDYKNEDATCEKEGKEVHYCKDCSSYYNVEIPKLQHDFSVEVKNSTKAKNPTCTKDGAKEYKCSKCDATDIVTIPALGHTTSDTSKIVTEPATCSEFGYVNTICDVCGDVANTEILAKAKHHYVREVLEVPTFEDDGIAVYACETCDKTKGNNITIKAYRSATIDEIDTIKTTTAIVRINESKDATGYVVRYSTNKNMKSAKTVTMKNMTDYVKLTKLTKNKTYYVQVKTIRDDMESAWSKKVSFKTLKK